ncbi:sensor histidine kinase [Parvularcula sp. LCG005]|uniref:sensor histidine kinase n=1 Tax=Parvularcula sp. LCG005 TaxID=3078805 RepID=UPI0029426063|nr:histidine kinase [Parvularcula sp. LCG005]WOI54814.1 histidine kinase [Parvularcula sp. LCG005]
MIAQQKMRAPAALPTSFSSLAFLPKLFVLWTVIGAVLALPNIIQLSEWISLPAKIIEGWAWALLTYLLLVIDRRLSRTGLSDLRQLIVLACLSVPFSFAYVGMAGLFLYPIDAVIWSPIKAPEFALYYFIGGWVQYAAVVGVMWAVKYHRRLLASQVEIGRLEKHILEARLNALRLQLEPHFLFNALNAISAETSRDPQATRDMIGNLAELLRHSLAHKDTNEISLKAELRLLDHYLSIQRLRFGDRIRFDINVDSAALNAVVPAMTLQPIVENALRHGVENRLSGGVVEIAAEKKGGHVHVTVSDNGVGLPRDWSMSKSSGLGLSVTRERLAALYGRRAEELFSISNRATEGTIVHIELPDPDVSL